MVDETANQQVDSNSAERFQHITLLGATYLFIA
jgi:hypothetical protein